MSMPFRWRQTLLPGLVGVALGAGLTSLLPLTAQQQPQPDRPAVPSAPPAFKAEVPARRGLDANLYMETAAEYRACCYQAFNLATVRLQERQLAVRDGKKKLAVVLDLDETVFDNSGYEAMMLRSGLAFDLRIWDFWEEKCPNQVALIPGALEFIREAEKLKVTVFYISNRSNRFKNSTMNALKHLEIAQNEDQVLLTHGPGDKTSRRKQVEKEHTVLLYLGDNLRDFDETFRCSVDNSRDETRVTDPKKLAAAIQERKAKVDLTRDKWGTDWIILPNPVYGEWTKPLGLGDADMEQLVPARTKKP